MIASTNNGNPAEIETLLIEKESLLQSIIESSPDVIVFSLDSDYRYTSFNSNHKNVMNHIWGADIDVGINILEVISSESDRARARENFDRALSGQHFMLTEEYGDENLSRHYWANYYSPLTTLDGTVIGLSCFVLNQTRQKEAENKVKSLLKEKEMIMREVHHRIKNNMSITHALLNIQANSRNNPEAKQILADAALRIQSMMVLYQKLYQSDTMQTVPLDTYIDSLFIEIKKILPDEKPVTIETGVEDINLPAHILSHVGIILNELITNSVKHAFNEQDSGIITILSEHNEENITIEYRDNGAGLPETAATDHQGFGMQLIAMLVKQMNADISISTDHGTRIRITFPVQ